MVGSIRWEANVGTCDKNNQRATSAIASLHYGLGWHLMQIQGQNVRMPWQPMTLDEYADYERGNGTVLEQVDGVWWRAIRPFFYRPLFPFTKLDPGSFRPPPKSLLGGYQHAVVHSGAANSYLNPIQFLDIHDYSIETTGKSFRKHVRKAARSLSVREIDDVNLFIAEAYPVYLEFYERTGYAWRKDRTEAQRFAEYSRRLFGFSKVLIWGVYAGDRLTGVSLSYVVQDVLFDASMFTTSEALKLGASDLLWHALRERAATAAGVNRIYEGMMTGHTGVDLSKILRGCHVSALPAYFRLNPLVQCLAKRFRRSDLLKVQGLSDSEVERVYCEEMGHHLSAAIPDVVGHTGETP